MDDSLRYAPVVGRKPLLSKDGQPVKPYTVKLFADQVDFLRDMGTGKASAWLRDLIARAMKRSRR